MPSPGEKAAPLTPDIGSTNMDKSELGVILSLLWARAMRFLKDFCYLPKTGRK
jgi:hypothetical protein